MAEAIPTLKTLDEFIETLSAQRGLHRKVRLLGHYWRQVRDLPPADRQRIALALGSESAWRHLEKFFGADGRLSEGELAVKRALRAVGSADPAELRILAGRLRSGDYAEVGDELLDAMGQALDAEGGIDELPRLELEPDPVLEPTPVPVPAAEPEPEVDESASEPVPGAERSAEVPSMPPLPPAEGVGLLAPAREPESDHGFDIDPLELEARAERRGLVTASGTAWRQRRFLGELIRERELESLDEALDLAALIESDVQRAWCLGDLVQHWPLDREQLERVLAAAPSVSVRGRLMRRHERAPLVVSR